MRAFVGLGAFKDQVTYVWASSRSPRHAYEQSCRPLSRARATLAKRGHPPWPVRRLGAFAQRGRAHCAYWAMCRQRAKCPQIECPEQPPTPPPPPWPLSPAAAAVVGTFVAATVAVAAPTAAATAAGCLLPLRRGPALGLVSPPAVLLRRHCWEDSVAAAAADADAGTKRQLLRRHGRPVVRPRA